MGNCKSAATKQKKGSLFDSDDQQIVTKSQRNLKQDRVEGIAVSSEQTSGEEEEEQLVTRRNECGLLDSPQESNMYDYPESPAMGLRSNTAFLPTPMLPAQAQWRSNVTSEQGGYYCRPVPPPLPPTQEGLHSDEHQQLELTTTSPLMMLPPSQRRDEKDNDEQQPHCEAGGEGQTAMGGTTMHVTSSSSCHSSVGGAVDADQHAEEQEAAIRRKASVATVREWFLSSMTMSQEELSLIPAT